MLRRSTVVVLVIAVVLVAAFLFWQQTRSNRETSDELVPTQGAQLSYNFSSADVVGITVQDQDRKTLILERQDGSWVLVRPASDRTDPQAVENALTQFLSMRTVNTISSATPLEDLGLKPPAYIVLLSLEDGSEHIINIGMQTPTGSGYYLLPSGPDRKIYIIGQFNIDTLLEMLQTPPILPEETPTPMPTP